MPGWRCQVLQDELIAIALPRGILEVEALCFESLSRSPHLLDLAIEALWRAFEEFGVGVPFQEQASSSAAIENMRSQE